MTPQLKIERGRAVLSLNRPERRNALDAGTLAELARLLEETDHSDTRLFVLRADGPVFCAGDDLKADRNIDGPGILDVCQALQNLKQPSLAVVEGGCIGSGLALACSCDMLLATRHAFFSAPELRLGFSPSPLLPVFLRAVPERQLRQLLFRGNRIDAETALQWGLVTQIVKPEAVDALLEEIHSDVMKSAPGAMATVKQSLNQIAERIAADLAPRLKEEFRRSRSSAEADEGRRAFRDGRTPRWTDAATIGEGR